MWDTAGQEQYKSLTRNFYRNSNGVLIVFDVTNKSTFEKVQEWVQSVEDNTEKNIKMVLVGNKIDLPREVSTEEGQKVANAFNIPYFETSAKESTGIGECMRAVIEEALKGMKSKDDSNINLDDGSNSKSRGCSC